MSRQVVVLAVADGVATLTSGRPEVLNAMDADTFAAKRRPAFKGG
jgi:enoyl-CoA hydratase/carnithine racemase